MTLLYWYGGKNIQAPRIVRSFLPHRKYVEPCAGSLAVLQAKGPAAVEVAGDKHAGLIHFYRTLTARPGAIAALIRPLPYDEVTFELARQWLHSADPLARAAGFLLRNRLSFGGLGRYFAAPSDGSRNRDGSYKAVNRWDSTLRDLDALAARLSGVRFRHALAVDLVREHDAEDTLFYVDPPYLHETRVGTAAYDHEMTEAEHVELLGTLLGCRGMVYISGYRSELYDSMLAGWCRVDRDVPSRAGSAGKGKGRRVESLWARGKAGLFMLMNHQ